MKTKRLAHFPFIVPEPQHMLPLEQVFCMVWLSQNYTLGELRAKQDVIQQQIQSASKRNLPTDNLMMMQDNISAAIAYQAFPNDSVWVSFIRMSE